jgi:hypothetical protein
MSDDRKPVWPWIVALLIGLPVLYVASFGPACWLESRGYVDADTVGPTYWPIVALYSSWRIIPVSEAIYWYATIGVPENGTASMREPGIYSYWQFHRE